jgi:hypothetical protein
MRVLAPQRHQRKFFAACVWGGFSKVCLINFLAKSGNSKHFKFFHFHLNKNCGHYVCLASTKIVVTIFACHLHNSSGMCFPACT